MVSWRVLLNGTSSETAALERKRQTTLPAIVDENSLFKQISAEQGLYSLTLKIALDNG